MMSQASILQMLLKRTEENRTELLNSEKNEYEVLSERADALRNAVEEVKNQFQSNE